MISRRFVFIFRFIPQGRVPGHVEGDPGLERAAVPDRERPRTHGRRGGGQDARAGIPFYSLFSIPT